MLVVGENVAEPPRPAAAKFRPEAFLALTQQDLGSPNTKGPISFWAEEARNEEWAVAMESQLKQRFSQEKLGPLGLTTMSLDSVECRTSTCRMEVSWTQVDAHAAQRSPDAFRFGGDPLGLLTLHTGPFATISQRAKPGVGEAVLPGGYLVRLRADGRFAASETIVFAASNIDPATYAEVIARVAANGPQPSPGPPSN